MLPLLLIACKSGDDDATGPKDAPDTGTPGGTGDTGAPTAPAPSGAVWILSGADVLAGTTTAAAHAVLSAGEGDAVGVALAPAGDLDGDGTAELAVGLGAGRVVIVPGSALQAGGAIDLSATGTTVEVGGTVTDLVVGRFDDDALPDLAVARSTWNGTAEEGTIGVWPGHALFPPSTFTFQDAIASIEDPLAEWIGQSLAAVDVDGDRVDDLVATARHDGGAPTTTAAPPPPARVDVYAGPTLADGARLDPTAAGWHVHGDADVPAAPLASAGDPDGDGRHDLWIGNFRFLEPAPGDLGWGAAAGGLALRDARPFPTGGDLDGDGVSELLTVLSTGQLLLFSGAEVTGGVGTTEARTRIDFGAIAAGILPDLDGDGVGELWGAREDPGTDPGEVRLFSGALALTDALPVGEPLAEIPAPAAEIGFGKALVAVDDLDGDGVPELALAATAATP